MKLVRLLASCLLLMVAHPSLSQSIPPEQWEFIIANINKKTDLTDTKNQLQQIKQQALAAGDYATVGRCLYYGLLVDDQKYEDTLFFKNARFMDSIIATPQAPPLLTAIMHVLKAKRLLVFTQRFLYRQNKNLVASYDAQHNYGRMGRDELDSLINAEFATALQTGGQLNDTKVESLLWLSNDPLVFLFKPSFTDMVYAEWINAVSTNAIHYGNGNTPPWLSASQDGFIQMADATTGFTRNELAVFRLYRQWMQYHGQQQPGAYYFIETLARKYFYHNLTPSTAVKKQYEQYLATLAASPYNTVRVNGVYQLCLLWNSEAANYNPVTNLGYGSRYMPVYAKKFDTAYRLYYQKALKLFGANRHLMDSFPFMRNILLAMQQKITEPALTIQATGAQLPGEAIPVMLHYRNIPAIYTRVVRISTSDTIYPGKSFILPYLLQLSAVAENYQPLPRSDDHQLHNAFLKIDALPTGRYAIIYSDTVIGNDIKRLDYVDISVTNIAVINNDQRIFVLNRKTGFPLQGASLVVNYTKDFTKGSTAKKVVMESAPYKINAQGYADIREQQANYVNVVYKSDTVKTTINKPSEHLPDNVYDTGGYDDLEEYYEDNLTVNIFTDRAIYRPGQTVYYKGICIIHDPKTGEPLVLNQSNLHFPFFQKLFGGATKELIKQKMELYIKNPFNKAVDTIHVLPNAFGSFSGSFTIPKDAATGDWDFGIKDYEIDRNSGDEFKVEEYKRPGFELAIKQPTNELYLGDSFVVKMQVKSFAGAQLNNVRIKYSVQRSGDVPMAGEGPDRKSIYTNDEILSGEAYTNNNGELLLHINDSISSKYQLDNERKWDMRYEITAEATDATGETHEESTSLTLSNRPVILYVPIPKAVDRNDLAPVYISAKSPIAGPVKKQVEVCLYKMPPTHRGVEGHGWAKTDVLLYDQSEIAQWLADTAIADNEEAPAGKTLVYKTNLSAGGDEKLSIPKEVLLCGNYRLEVTSMEHGNITGKADKEFAVYDKSTRTLPGETASFQYMQYNSVEAGKPIAWVTGNTVQDVFSIYHLAYYTKTKKGIAVKYDYDILPEKKGLNEWTHTMPAAVDHATLTHLYIINNQLYRQVQELYVTNTQKANPEIIVEQYRKTLAPGSKQTFTVSVKTNNENIAAELMTTMYDATLDKLEKHEWRIPDYRGYFSINNHWDYTINGNTNTTLYYGSTNYGLKYDTGGLWWINNAVYQSLGLTGSINAGGGNSLMGTVAGLQISNTDGLEDVVVVGYASVKKSLGYSTIMIRGATSLSNYSKLLVILDGVPYDGDITKINTSAITNGIVLKGADATAISGSRAAGGVLLLSTKGPVQIPAPPEMPVPVTRKNFAETAFFYPQVHAGRDGYYTITFTLPESVTEWKWKMLAHTKKAAFAYAEKTLNSQLQLMVQPNMPRFLYQGDTIKLPCRITNLDTAALTGNLQCVIEDVVTGEDISNRLLAATQQPFTVMPTSNSSGAFVISVPPGLLHPLRIKITAATKTFGDGEEHVIPVLAKKILVGQNIPLTMQGFNRYFVPKPMLPADAELYGLGLYISPKPQAALLNALPYLAEYPYGCAEQTFNKLLAHTIAIKIVRTDTTIQQSLSRNTGKQDAVAADALPGELGEQTMPWLQLSHAVAIHQQQLAKLLDTAQAHQNIQKYFAYLQGLQNTNGSVSWFKGGESSWFISTYLLAGFGKLQKDSLLFLDGHTNDFAFKDFVHNLILFCDDEASNPLKSAIDLDYLYARSFWLQAYQLPAIIQQKADSLLSKSWAGVGSYGLGRQAMLITATLQYAAKEGVNYQKALRQLESIRQLAVTDELNGTRWKSISDEDDLDMQAEEWVAKLGEAFKTGGQPAMLPGIVQWLLQTKSEHNWGTTKSTAEVAGLLNTVKPAVTGPNLTLTTTVNDSVLRVTDDLLGGKLIAFYGGPRKLLANNMFIQANTDQPIAGGINYYYFTASPPANTTTESISIKKMLYRYNSATRQWDTVTQQTCLHIADKIKTEITIETRGQLNFVFIEDRHAAALEPLDMESGYNYGNAVGYYQSVRDAGMQFFAEKIPSGISAISYETRVAAEGTFTNGTASLQCMYKPQVHVYSGSMVLGVKP